MNLILCILFLIIIALYTGTVTTTIDQVTAGSPAEAAGIQSGDKIVAVDQKKTDDWASLVTTIGTAKEEVTLEVERDGQNLTLTSDLTEAEDGRMVIGIVPVREHNVLTAIKDGTVNTWNMTKMMVDTFRQLFTGDVSVKELSGPVGIVYAVNDTAQYGFVYLLYLTALISLNLAIVNMLPLPALDGGRLLFIIVRKITGKAITDEMEGKVHFIGIMLLFALMIYVTWNDIVRFIVPIFN